MIENEQHNKLKTERYNLEHNLGYGKQNLATLRSCFDPLEFSFHTVFEITGPLYCLIRENLSRRDRSFYDTKVLTQYLLLENWQALTPFMPMRSDLEDSAG